MPNEALQLHCTQNAARLFLGELLEGQFGDMCSLVSCCSSLVMMSHSRRLFLVHCSQFPVRCDREPTRVRPTNLGVTSRAGSKLKPSAPCHKKPLGRRRAQFYLFVPFLFFLSCALTAEGAEPIVARPQSYVRLFHSVSFVFIESVGAARVTVTDQASKS